MSALARDDDSLGGTEEWVATAAAESAAGSTAGAGWVEGGREAAGAAAKEGAAAAAALAFAASLAAFFSAYRCIASCQSLQHRGHCQILFSHVDGVRCCMVNNVPHNDAYFCCNNTLRRGYSRDGAM